MFDRFSSPRRGSKLGGLACVVSKTLSQHNMTLDVVSCHTFTTATTFSTVELLWGLLKAEALTPIHDRRCKIPFTENIELVTALIV